LYEDSAQGGTAPGNLQFCSDASGSVHAHHHGALWKRCFSELAGRVELSLAVEKPLRESMTAAR